MVETVGVKPTTVSLQNCLAISEHAPPDKIKNVTNIATLGKGGG